MRIAIFGGSFNPPHLGHMSAALLVLHNYPIDQVWFTPSGGNHPFRKVLAPFQDRIGLIRNLIGDRDRLDICDVEEAHNVSYTVDVLDTLRTLHPEHTFRIVIGADCWRDRAKWHNWDRIQQEYDPIVLGREGVEVDIPTPFYPIAMSSTEVRKAIAEGGPLDPYAPRISHQKMREMYR